jgi:nucleoside-diphosphate-sugar epimerase
MTRVVVTGGTGFVGGWCIVQALEAGHEVVTTVRSRAKETSVRDAVRAQVADEALRVVGADLTSDDGWDDALRGSDVVLHVASPMVADVGDPSSLVGPAVDGTVRVLTAATRAGVHRVVLTSSCAAATPVSTQMTGTVDESCWTDADEPGLSPYRRSKALAERAAWEWVERESPSFTLTTILPGSVFGPALSPAAMNSLQLISRLIDGSIPAIPRLAFEVVDVRDVAAAHLLAMSAPGAAGERFIAAGERLWFGDVAAILRAQLGDDAAKVPTAELPDDVLRSLAESNAELRSLLPLLGRELVHDAGKARAVLGWEPRPVVETIVDSGRCILAMAG